MTFPLIDRVRRLAEKATKPWLVAYNNDTGPNDEGFAEWWEVVGTNGVLIAKCDDEETAKAITDAPALADGYEQALKALTRITQLLQDRCDECDFMGDDDAAGITEARRVLALAEKDVS